MEVPARRRRRPFFALLATLALTPGCVGVHSRQWGYPNGTGRLADFGKGFGRSAKARAPKVNLRVEDAEIPDSTGTALGAPGA